MDETRMESYRAGARIARERMATDAPGDARVLEEVEPSDIVVVRGAYDQVEAVLEALALPSVAVEPSELWRLSLRPEQLLVANCPGQVDRRSIVQIRDFARPAAACSAPTGPCGMWSSPLSQA